MFSLLSAAFWPTPTRVRGSFRDVDGCRCCDVALLLSVCVVCFWFSVVSHHLSAPTCCSFVHSFFYGIAFALSVSLTDDNVNSEAAKQMKDGIEGFEKQAAADTTKYAMD